MLVTIWIRLPLGKTSNISGWKSIFDHFPLLILSSEALMRSTFDLCFSLFSSVFSSLCGYPYFSRRMLEGSVGCR